MADVKDRFLFSAQSLQTFADCERRFELRYIESCLWPATEAEPFLAYEKHMENGRRFHEAVHRHFIGIEPAGPVPTSDGDLQRWWDAFIAFAPDIVLGRRYPEQTIFGHIGGYPVSATYDLIIVGDGKITIYDWKTYRKRPLRQTMQNRLQTHVYPYIAVQAGREVFDISSIFPDKIEMIYWYTDFPEKPETFVFDEDLYRASEVYLIELVERIETLKSGSFQKTSDQKRCGYCTYRSLCERGRRAGSMESTPEEADVALSDDEDELFSFDDIEAIEFT